MTLQEILDKNYDWFFVQGNPPGWDRDAKQCVYVGLPVDGKPCRCAVGCLLPESGPLVDAVRRPGDSNSSSAMTIRVAGMAKYLFGVETKHWEYAWDFEEDVPEARKVRELQRLHDRSAEGAELSGDSFSDLYLPQLHRWAKQNGLTWREGWKVPEAEGAAA